MIYVDAWVIKYEDRFVESGDPLRSMSVCIFRRIFGESQEPRAGFVIDSVGSTPAAYRTGGTMTDSEREIWSKFWEYANNPVLAGRAGIRAAHGEAPSIKLMLRKRYRILLRASAGLENVTEEAPGRSGDKQSSSSQQGSGQQGAASGAGARLGAGANAGGVGSGGMTVGSKGQGMTSRQTFDSHTRPEVSGGHGDDGRGVDYGNAYVVLRPILEENYSDGTIKIVNPARNGATLNYMLNGNVFSNPPGCSQDIREDRAWVIRFSRGANLDEVQYWLPSGVYTFACTDHGWDLFRSELPRTVAPQLPMAIPMNPLSH